MRKPVIGVMGGGRVDDRIVALARELGACIAKRGWVLLNGGRNSGVMAASARGAKEAGGTVVGVLPDHDTHAASPDLDVAIVTGMGDARNVINVLSSDVVVACSGGAGTLSEVAIALKSGKPVILLGFAPGPVLEDYRRAGRLISAEDPAEVVEQAARLLEDLGRG
jgi:uncharacterized protein (TIGR00725 family)